MISLQMERTVLEVYWCPASGWVTHTGRSKLANGLRSRRASEEACRTQTSQWHFQKQSPEDCAASVNLCVTTKQMFFTPGTGTLIQPVSSTVEDCTQPEKRTYNTLLCWPTVVVNGGGFKTQPNLRPGDWWQCLFTQCQQLHLRN